MEARVVFTKHQSDNLDLDSNSYVSNGNLCILAITAIKDLTKFMD